MAGGINTAAALGFAAPAAAVVRTGRATESWTVTADDVDAWLRTANPGETFIYAHGPQLVHGAAAARVTELTAAGDVAPHHKRADDGGFDFLIRRLAKRITRAPVCDAMMLSVLVVLQDAAGAGERCPSDAEIAAATGFAVRQVKWLIEKLEAAKFIVRRTIRAKAGERFRIVTVVATGATTAEPTA